MGVSIEPCTFFGTLSPMKRLLSKAPRTLASTCAYAMLVCATIPSVTAETPPFPDMASSWFGYQESVAYLVEKGAIGGYPDGTFKPRTTVNRAEFLKLVFRSRTSAEPVTTECFADVKPDAWYAPYVCAAKRRGVVKGYKVGSRILFKADQPILFAEAIKMVSLAYDSDVVEGSGERWYEPYVNKLDRESILPGASYVPWEPISRERAADLIARFVKHEEERVLSNQSPGCAKAPAEGPLTVTVDGVERSYLLAKPAGYVSHDSYPLIVAFHGRTNSNEQVRDYFGFERNARDYFVAYPAGTPNGGGFSWAMPSESGKLGDVAFFDALVKQVGERYCINTDRIFVAGHSLGAWMANAVACARGGVVRASATVGGSFILKNCAGPTAAMIINNPKDSSSPQASAEAMRNVRLKENACGTNAESAQPSSLSCVEYEGCPNNPVLFCPHTIDTDHNGTYYPHQWPRGTGEDIVDFFNAR